MEPQSSAEFFFRQIVDSPDPAAALRGLVGATPATDENEWREFKGAASLSVDPRDSQLKRIWSEALSGFANTQGGVLILGIDARKDPLTGIDGAGGFSRAPNPGAFKSRLQQLHGEATDPPVLGVDIRDVADPTVPGTGFVVCLVPESRFKPHRAEHRDKQYMIRAGDDFRVAGTSMLRTLFYPRTSARLRLKATVDYAPGGIPNASVTIDVRLENIGSATAKELFVVVRRAPDEGKLNKGLDWENRKVEPFDARFSAKHPLHPGSDVHLFSYHTLVRCHTTTGNPQFVVDKLQFPNLEIAVQMFMLDGEAQMATIKFNQVEVNARQQKSFTSEPCNGM